MSRRLPESADTERRPLRSATGAAASAGRAPDIQAFPPLMCSGSYSQRRLELFQGQFDCTLILRRIDEQILLRQWRVIGTLQVLGQLNPAPPREEIRAGRVQEPDPERE